MLETGVEGSGESKHLLQTTTATIMTRAVKVKASVLRTFVDLS